MTDQPEDVESYLAAQPERTRAALEEVRRVVAEVIPDGEESLSYRMPTVSLGGRRVVHYAGWARHVSLYPPPRGDEDLRAAMAPYSAGRGTLKFPLDRHLPTELIGRIVRALVAESGA